MCIIRCEKRQTKKCDWKTSTSISSHDQETQALDLSCKPLARKCNKIMKLILIYTKVRWEKDMI